MKKRLLSLALCLALCLGLFPFGVLAEEASEDNSGDATTAVAEVTQKSADGRTLTTNYNTLQAALDKAKSSYFADSSTGTVQSAEVKLLRDVDVGSSVVLDIVYNDSVTLDLNGCTLSHTSEKGDTYPYSLMLYNTAHPIDHLFIIKNGKIVNNADLSNHAAIGVSTGTMILENIIVTGNGNTYSVNVAGGGNLEVQGDCTFNGPVYVKGSGSAKLSGGVYKDGIYANANKYPNYIEMLETGYIFIDKDKNYIEASSLNANSIQSLEVVACNHRDSDSKSTFGDDYVCTRCKYTCTHKNGFDNEGKCNTCLKPFVAQVGGTAYTNISDAFNAANGAEGSTLTLLADGRTGGSATATGNWTLDLNGHNISSFSIGQAADLGNQKDAIPGNLTITGSGTAYSTEVKNGTLTVSDNDVTIQGLSIASGGNAVLSGGTYTVGSIDASIKMDDSNKKVASLLASGYAFQSADKDGGIVNGYVQELKESVKVVKHNKHNVVDGKCDCGLTCDHKGQWKNGVCSNCGYACPHSTVTESGDGVYTCSTCEQEMGAEIGDGDKYYATIDAAISAAGTGDTITMLKDVSTSATFNQNKSLTLNLNGHSLRTLYPSFSGKLALTGGGSVNDIYVSSELDLSTWTGSVTHTLDVKDSGKLIIGSKIGNIEQLYLNNGGGSVKISGGKFHTIGGNNIKPSQFLDTGYALWGICRSTSYTAGYIGYETICQGNEIHDAEVRPCTAHVDADSNNLCDYCNTNLTGMVASVLMDGKTYYYADLATALETANATNDPITITLLQDVTGLDQALTLGDTPNLKDNKITLDLNGKTLSGTGGEGNTFLTVDTYGSVTIRDSSEAKTGSIKSTKSGDYAVYVSEGKLTIEGGKFEGTDGEQPMSIKGYALGIGSNDTTIISGGTFLSPVNVYSGTVKISGGTFVSLYNTNGTISSLLADGYAFADSSTKAIQNSYTTSTLNNVTVVPHNHTWTVENENKSSCACGLTCNHEGQWKNGVCGICGYQCPHTNIAEGGKCQTCSVQMEAQIGSQYYETFAAAVSAAPTDNSATTIKLLDDVYTGNGKNIPENRNIILDMNGKNITRKSAGGFVAITNFGKLKLENGGSLYDIDVGNITNSGINTGELD